MNNIVSLADDFKREFRRLRKRYRSLDDDLAGLLADIRSDPFIGIDIGNNMRKIRLRVASKGRGNGGGGDKGCTQQATRLRLCDCLKTGTGQEVKL